MGFFHIIISTISYIFEVRRRGESSVTDKGNKKGTLQNGVTHSDDSASIFCAAFSLVVKCVTDDGSKEL